MCVSIFKYAGYVRFRKLFRDCFQIPDEIEELRLAVERNQRSADEAQGREQRAAADAASATGRLGLLLEEHQTLKDELHLQRSVVSQLNEQLAAQPAQPVRTADPDERRRGSIQPPRVVPDARLREPRGGACAAEA